MDAGCGDDDAVAVVSHERTFTRLLFTTGIVDFVSQQLANLFSTVFIPHARLGTAELQTLFNDYSPTSTTTNDQRPPLLVVTADQLIREWKSMRPLLSHLKSPRAVDSASTYTEWHQMGHLLYCAERFASIVTKWVRGSVGILTDGGGGGTSVTKYETPSPACPTARAFGSRLMADSVAASSNVQLGCVDHTVSGKLANYDRLLDTLRDWYCDIQYTDKPFATCLPPPSDLMCVYACMAWVAHRCTANYSSLLKTIPASATSVIDFLGFGLCWIRCVLTPMSSLSRTRACCVDRWWTHSQSADLPSDATRSLYLPPAYILTLFDRPSGSRLYCNIEQLVRVCYSWILVEIFRDTPAWYDTAIAQLQAFETILGAYANRILPHPQRLEKRVFSCLR